MSLKFVAIGCIHGNLRKRTLNLIKKEEPDLIVVSGDFSGGDFSEKLREYEKKLVDKFGPIPDFWPLNVQIDSDKHFRKWAKMSAQNTSNIFREMKKLKMPVLYIHGNWDSVGADQMDAHLDSSVNFPIDKAEGKNMKFIHGKVSNVKGFSFGGFGGYRGTSVKEYLYKDLPEPRLDPSYIKTVREDLEVQMSKLFSKVKSKRRMIFVTHDPPYKTFDFLESEGKFYGEKISSEMIRRHKPLMCVCSHFHEHRGVKKIGSTTVVASGYGHDGQMAIIETDGKKVDVNLV